jgi:hypothetical protein
MIISLWSGPRNLSTALMYYFAHRGDIEVMDEPFFGAFLDAYPVWRPSRAEVLQNMDLDRHKIAESIKTKSLKGPLFLKNMANHRSVIPATSRQEWHNIILFREPSFVIASYQKNMAEISLFDLAYREQHLLLQELRENGKKVYLLDSDQLAQNPAETLAHLSNFLHIPFKPKMLEWPKGPISEDGIWAKYWYQKVHKSVGFSAQTLKEKPSLDSTYEALYQDALVYYKKLKKVYDEQI